MGSNSRGKIRYVSRDFHGFNAYDFNAIDDPIPLSQDAKGLPAYLRDVRRVSLRHAFRLESVEESSRRLLALIESYTHT